MGGTLEHFQGDGDFGIFLVQRLNDVELALVVGGVVVGFAEVDDLGGGELGEDFGAGGGLGGGGWGEEEEEGDRGG